MGRIHVRGHQEAVSTGQDRADGDLTVAVLVTNALHPQRVGDDDAAEAELAAKDAGEDGLAQGGGVA